jgi:Mn-dependent DtxR family transcriptional regulator
LMRLLDEEKASLRVLCLLYVRTKGIDLPKMTIRRIAKLLGISKSTFDKTYKTLQNLGLAEDRKVNIAGKKGQTKYPKLTPMGLEVAEQAMNIRQLLQGKTMQPVVIIR